MINSTFCLKIEERKSMEITFDQVQSNGIFWVKMPFGTNGTRIN
jgi:hypothetical protein